LTRGKEKGNKMGGEAPFYFLFIKKRERKKRIKTRAQPWVFIAFSKPGKSYN